MAQAWAIFATLKPETNDKHHLADMSLRTSTCVAVFCVLFLMMLSLPGCMPKQTGSNAIRVERSPEWGVGTREEEEPVVYDETDEEDLTYAEYTPKATFTSVDTMDSLLGEYADYYFGKVNDKFLKGCYYTGPTSTPLLASFAERWNKMAFLRRFVNAEEVFERENDGLGDSLATEMVRGVMPVLPNEYKLAFRDKESQALARKLVRMLTTIDYVPEQMDRMSDCFKELVAIPFETPEFISDEEMDLVSDTFWELYDKTRYIEDYETIQKRRADKNATHNYLVGFTVPLQLRYIQEEDFDSRCILAIELSCYDFPDAVDYLGELIEDGRYSKYLFEVWLSWRLRAQSAAFGISTWSEIPDNLYDNARLLVAKAYLKHIAKEPSDNLAKLLLLNLMYTENLHRRGGYYGNESLGADLLLCRRYFLPNQDEED